MIPQAEAEPGMRDADDLRSTFGFDQPDEHWLARLLDAETADNLGHFGTYELLEEIGHGGQGAVYKARQPGTNRIVALKRLSAGSFATSMMRARFEREVEAASALNHPSIVRVYGTDCIRGQQVLVMEWIDGQPVDQWALHPVPAAPMDVDAGDLLADPSAASTPHGLAESTVRSVREILTVFAQVCSAVSHAHQRGVLHRDLKPSNILIDRHDQPHVLDFGLAKVNVLDESSQAAPAAMTLTRSGFMGTPAYASPEQVAGDVRNVDARSDVFALGVILYQMLTGVTPWGATKSIAELFDAIRQQTPPRPSQRRRAINREVDAIVMKAIEKEPHRRYQSVDALGADVRRFLANETVLAHPPSAAYQARKFIARHRAVFFAGVIALMALLGSLAGVSMALLQTQIAQQEARRAEHTADQVNDFLNQMLASADPSVIRGHDLHVRTLLDEAVRRLDAGALADQVEAEARIRTTIAQSYQSLGLFPPARTQFMAALEKRRQSVGDMHIETASAMLQVAEMLRRDEEYEAAEQMASESQQILRRLVGDDHEQTIRAKLLGAVICCNYRDIHEGRRMLCDLLEQAIGLKGNDVNELVIDIKSEIGFMGHCSDDASITHRILQETLEAQQQLFGEDDERLARTYINLGQHLFNQGKRADGEQMTMKAVDIRRRVSGEDHPAFASALYNLANIVRATRGQAAAEILYRQALEIQQRRLSPGHYYTGRTRMRLGACLAAQEKHVEAEPVLLQAVDELKSRPGRMAARANWARHHLAIGYIQTGRYEDAERVIFDMLAYVEKSQFEVEASMKGIAALFVQLYEAWGRNTEADHWPDQVAGDEVIRSTGSTSD